MGDKQKHPSEPLLLLTHWSAHSLHWHVEDRGPYLRLDGMQTRTEQCPQQQRCTNKRAVPQHVGEGGTLTSTLQSPVFPGQNLRNGADGNRAVFRAPLEAGGHTSEMHLR